MSCRMFGGQRLVAGDAVDQRIDFALGQPIDGERGRRAAARSRARSNSGRKVTISSARRLCDAVHRAGRALRGSSGRSNARPRRSSAPDLARVSASICAISASSVLLPALLRRRGRARDSGRRSAATASRQRARRPRSRSTVCASSASSLSSFACGVVVARKPGGALHLADDRIERAVGVLRRAEIAQPRVRLRRRGAPAAPPSAATCRCRPRRRAARPGLRRLRLGPAPQQQVRVLLPARPARSGRSRAAPRSGSPSNSRRSAAQARAGPAMPLRSCGPRSRQLEQVAEQPARALGDDDAVRLGDALQPRREVRRLADDAALLRLPRSDQVADDDEPGRDPTRTCSGAPAAVRVSARPRRSRARPAPRARRHAHAPGDSRNRRARRRPCIWRRSRRCARTARAAAMIGADDLAHVLRVEPRRESRSSRRGRRTSP